MIQFKNKKSFSDILNLKSKKFITFAERMSWKII